jgi:heme/copper-type cytochrome/quinol oxidase subunit 3
MTNIGVLLVGAFGCAVGVQSLDRPRPSRLLRVVALAVMLLAFFVANRAALALLNV